MESVIKWQTGKPKEKGIYIVTYEFGYYPAERPLDKLYGISIGTSYWDSFWHQYNDEMSDCKIIAWCPFNDIEPYKECNFIEKVDITKHNVKTQPCVLTNHGIDTDIVKFD